MRASLAPLALGLCLSLARPAVALFHRPDIHALRAQMQLDAAREEAYRASLTRRQAPDPTTLYPERWMSVPVDHFHNESRYEPHSDGTFELRYWFDASRYRPGGPVVVLAAGETSGVGRLKFLQKGIVAQLAEATGGLGVILEHRYYGASVVTDDLATESLRFLTTQQAMADTAYFARHVVFPGLEHLDLTAPATPWILYGGSYAGAFVAFCRKLYPDLFWGAVSSSGVTAAVWDYWQYYEAARLHVRGDCVEATQKLTHVVDNILDDARDDYPRRLKTAFQLGNLTHDADFASAISGGIAGLQGLNWDPAENSTALGRYCDAVSSRELLYPAAEPLRAEVVELLAAGGYAAEACGLAGRMLNYIGYVNQTVASRCRGDQDACLGNLDEADYRGDSLADTWRLWPYQYCTQWGYIQTGSGVPPSILPMIPRQLTLPYLTFICRAAFNISEPARVDEINRHGGFAISYPRLAIIDGEADPWRAATPHALGLPDRESTPWEPFYLIRGGAVHHWDENGVFANETTADFPPPEVRDAQAAVREWVLGWMEEWEETCGG